MKTLLVSALAAAFACCVTPSEAHPNAPIGDLADNWFVQSHGQVVCTVKLSTRGGRGGAHAISIPAACGDVLAGVSGWRPTSGGLDLVGADGAPVASFDRWSESLFVASSRGADLQLSRAVGRTGDR